MESCEAAARSARYNVVLLASNSPWQSHGALHTGRAFRSPMLHPRAYPAATRRPSRATASAGNMHVLHGSNGLLAADRQQLARQVRTGSPALARGPEPAQTRARGRLSAFLAGRRRRWSLELLIVSGPAIAQSRLTGHRTV
eukprot:36728-Pleurochrysis_carterae.AAC.2